DVMLVDRFREHLLQLHVAATVALQQGQGKADMAWFLRIQAGRQGFGKGPYRREFPAAACPAMPDVSIQFRIHASTPVSVAILHREGSGVSFRSVRLSSLCRGTSG